MEATVRHGILEGMPLSSSGLLQADDGDDESLHTHLGDRDDI